jgi:predicted nucleotidyltransferase
MFSSFGMTVQSDPLTYFEDVYDSLRQLERNLSATILIYGSVARHGCGNDLDLIIVGTEEMWQEFRQKVLDKLPSYCGALIRHNAAYEVLGSAFGALEEEGIMLVDVYIFPPDWTKRLNELQSAFPHEDPHFMQNIATDVKTLGECAIQSARMS